MFRVSGVGVSGLRFRVKGSGFRLRDQGSDFRVSGWGFGV